MPELWKKQYIDNQKVQVADEIKRDICKYLVIFHALHNFLEF